MNNFAADFKLFADFLSLAEQLGVVHAVDWEAVADTFTEELADIALKVAEKVENELSDDPDMYDDDAPTIGLYG